MKTIVVLRIGDVLAEVHRIDAPDHIFPYLLRVSNGSLISISYALLDFHLSLGLYQIVSGVDTLREWGFRFRVHGDVGASD